jgi:superfamily II DNA or RNA helicase
MTADPDMKPKPLEILVDSDVQLVSTTTPRGLVQAMRRQLKRHDLSQRVQHSQGQKRMLSMLSSEGGAYRIPQALLPEVTDACRRQGIAFSVNDRRSMVSCSAVRCLLSQSEQQQKGLRRLLLKESGVVVAPDAGDRLVLTAELVARRRQKTLLVTTDDARETWLSDLRTALDLPSELIVPFEQASAGSQLVIARYEDLRAAAGAPEETSNVFGMVIFDALHEISPLPLVNAVRNANARYLVGLSNAARRADGLEGSLFMMLGGIIAELAAESPDRALKLAYRRRLTSFSFPYEGRSQYQKLLAALAADQRRNEQIVAEVMAEVNAGQPCLLLSERRDHLQSLLEALSTQTSAEALTSEVRPADRASVVARFDAGETMVLLATGQIALEAIKTPRVARLFIAFPFSYGKKLKKLVENLFQPAADQRELVIYDYDDVSVAPLQRACDKRHQTISRLQKSAEAAYMQWAQLPLQLDK